MQQTRYRPTDRDKEVRADARWKIVQEVNKHLMRVRAPIFTRIAVPDRDHRDRTGRETKMVTTFELRQANLISIRDIQRAVNIARRFNLVDDLTLQRAGYSVRRGST